MLPWHYHHPQQPELITRIEHFAQAEPSLTQLFGARSSRLLRAVARLVGEQRVALFKEKLIPKLPGSEGFEPHQDVQAGWDAYPVERFYTAVVSVDRNTRANGCLQVVAGRHREGILGPMLEPLPPAVVDALDWRDVEMEPGDLLVFDSFVPHRSKPNLSSGTRRNFYVTFNGAREGDWRQAYYDAKARSFPPDVDRVEGKEYKYKV